MAKKAAKKAAKKKPRASAGEKTESVKPSEMRKGQVTPVRRLKSLLATARASRADITALAGKLGSGLDFAGKGGEKEDGDDDDGKADNVSKFPMPRGEAAE